MLTPVPLPEDAKEYLMRAEKVYQWLLSQLSNQ
jgi:hypothetical protein